MHQEDPKGKTPGLESSPGQSLPFSGTPETQPKYTQLGTMTGSLQIGATVNDGESVALDQLAQWTKHPIQVAVDSKIAIKRVHTPNIEIRMPGLWSTPQEKRSLLQVTWTKGHLTAEQHSQRFGPSQAWAWTADLAADKECGARSHSVFSFTQAAVTENIDRAARATCSWLGKRCAHMLAHDPVPRAKELKFEAVPVVNKKVQKQGLNKRQQLLAATELVNPSTGHSWVVTANSKNLCIKCETCTLFVQQTDPIPLVEFVLQHPCRHRPAEPSPSAKIDPSHSVLNLGHLWSCSRCKASYSVRAPAKGRLANKCKGKEAKKERDDSAGADSSKSGFAALFFRDRLKQGLPENLGPKHAQSANAKHEDGQDGNRPSIVGEGCGLSTMEHSSQGALGGSIVVKDESFPRNPDPGEGGSPPGLYQAQVLTSEKPQSCRETSKWVGNEARVTQPRQEGSEQRLMFDLVVLPQVIKNLMQNPALLKPKPQLRKLKERCLLLQTSWLEFLSLKAKPTAVARVPLTNRRTRRRTKVLRSPRLELRACFISLRLCLRSRSCRPTAMGGGKGKGKHKSKRSAEEVLHAREVNRQREESSLPKKSTGSVSRSKARSAAYHAAISAPISADTIAEPKVRPPPPPPPRRGEGIRLVPRDEILPRSTDQPGTPSKGTAPQPKDSQPKTGGEFLPPAKTSPKKRDQGEQGRNKQKAQKRGESLPQPELSESAASNQRLLPQDAMELHTSSSTEEEAASMPLENLRSKPAPVKRAAWLPGK